MILDWIVFYAECGLASLGERLSGRLERILSGWVEEVSRFLGFLHTASHSTSLAITDAIVHYQNTKSISTKGVTHALLWQNLV